MRVGRLMQSLQLAKLKDVWMSSGQFSQLPSRSEPPKLARTWIVPVIQMLRQRGKNEAQQKYWIPLPSEKTSIGFRANKESVRSTHQQRDIHVLRLNATPRPNGL
jgi:hypothetical protein